MQEHNDECTTPNSESINTNEEADVEIDDEMIEYTSDEKKLGYDYASAGI